MIDRIARENLAERLRQLASGSITNIAFEKRGRRGSQDTAISVIEDDFAWRFYDDFAEHRLDGRFKLSDEQKRVFARAVLFLKADIECRWPRKTPGRTLLCFLGRVLTLGIWEATEPVEGDFAVWPFWCRREYDEALERPPYLRGHETIA